MRSQPFAPAALGLTLAVLCTLTLAAAAAAAPFRLEKRLPLAAGGSFALSSEAGGVEVRGGDVAEAQILVTSNRDDFAELYDVRFATPRPDRIEVVIEKKSRGPAGWFGGGSGRTEVQVTLPKRRLRRDRELRRRHRHRGSRRQGHGRELRRQREGQESRRRRGALEQRRVDRRRRTSPATSRPRAAAAASSSAKRTAGSSPRAPAAQ